MTSAQDSKVVPWLSNTESLLMLQVHIVVHVKWDEHAFRVIPYQSGSPTKIAWDRRVQKPAVQHCLFWDLIFSQEHTGLGLDDCRYQLLHVLRTTAHTFIWSLLPSPHWWIQFLFLWLLVVPRSCQLSPSFIINFLKNSLLNFRERRRKLERERNMDMRV